MAGGQDDLGENPMRRGKGEARDADQVAKVGTTVQWVTNQVGRKTRPASCRAVEIWGPRRWQERESCSKSATRTTLTSHTAQLFTTNGHQVKRGGARGWWR